MAKKHGKNTVVTIAGSDLSAYISSSDFSRTASADETTSYGEDSRTYIPGLKDSTFSFSGFYDDAVAGPPDILIPLVGTSVAVVRQIEGVGSGLPNEAFSGVLTTYDESAPVDGVITISGDIQVSGDVTRTDQS